MLFYKVYQEDSLSAPAYRTKARDAHIAAKMFDDRSKVAIDLLDIQIDKAAVLALLNGEAAPVTSVVQRWALNSRGALVEIKD